jgi:hypothetical protein
VRLFKDADGDVDDVSAVRPGMLQEIIGTASFNDTRGRVKIVGFNVWGDLVRIIGHASRAMHQEPLNVSWTYSNTASTLTLNRAVYRVIYTDVSGEVAGAAYFQRLDGECAVSGSAHKKR